MPYIRRHTNKSLWVFVFVFLDFFWRTSLLDGGGKQIQICKSKKKGAGALTVDVQ